MDLSQQNLHIFQHQQQVATAVERAKQVTISELNAIIGVRIFVSTDYDAFLFIH